MSEHTPAAGNGNGQNGQGERGGERGLLWWLGALTRRKEAESVRERFEALVDGSGEEGDPGEPPELDAAERLLLGNVLKLRGKTALDVMVPRADIVAMPEKLTLQQAIELIQREGHSRLPVYRENLDDIVGMVHIKDVFAAVGHEAAFDLKAILRKPLFVAPQIPVLDLLLQMRMARIHLALVVDEYGGIDGLVTIEDLVETIVGDISDEHDEEELPQIVERPDGTLDVDARMPVEDFEARMGPILTPEEHHQDIDTVGGLVFTLAGRVPKKGELVSHPGSGLEFRVLESDPRRIRRLRVRRPLVDNPADTRQAAE
ncbi:Magnesium and cobalt efflux protein corC [Roseomonas mucosa]|uniref:Hemolysin C n=1 Tax=Roseomonas mucosa TaxID=207340 RepID=A0A1S8D5Q8_9PROT|nr:MULTISPECIES: hemolysin family protein [Roseomonas]MBS5903563.1 HlyC/CorC family transporter [Acetobacteraceae bacterium]MDT8263995.1 hemolysin family protein [Roseomonas sp. DSM 102946]ATR21756.1 HlyC/CorC family transporter [Roseomonas sp. FDAARGOS_362]AWV21544.1 Magnesium and cobalt efflux protein corC [Roseomonas mucosa]MCG7351844.1 hemolysin family protein [Roseomonas mucosa]